MTAPALVLLANGSADDSVVQVVHTLRKRMRAMRPALTVELAFVNHCEPSCRQIATALSLREVREAVFVPLDITRVYRASDAAVTAIEHVRQQVPDLSIRLSRPLGPSADLLGTIDLRLRQALSACHAAELDGLVFAVPNSGDARGNALMHRRARQWRTHHRLPVQLAYADNTGQSIAGAVAALRAQGRRSIAVGFFYLDADNVYTTQASLALEAGAIAVAAPLGDDTHLLDLAMARYSVAALDLLDDVQPADLAFDDVPDLSVTPALSLVAAVNF